MPTPSILWASAAFLALAACQRKVPEPDAPPVSSAPASAEAKVDVVPSAPAASSARVKELGKDDLVPGKGKAAKRGDRVKVHYTGTLLDGTKFDSSLDRGTPFEFTLGRGEVIKGWDEGVVGMKKGGKRRLTIPSDMAYGRTGSPPKIPPDAPLKFEIELVDFANG